MISSTYIYRGMRESPDVTCIQSAGTRPNLDIVMFAKVTKILLDSNLTTVSGEFYRVVEVKPLVELPGVDQNFHDHTRCEINYTTTLPFPKDGEISQESLDELRAYETWVLSSNMVMNILERISIKAWKIALHIIENN